MGEAADYSGIQTVFLDRDGVLNRKAPEGAYVFDWEHVEVLPGAAEAVRLLTAARMPIYVVSNQRGVALGLYTSDQVQVVHGRIAEHLAAAGGEIGGFFFCPHDRDCCDCRKPASGLFEQARSLHPEIRWETSVMIGDSLSDIDAGASLGMQTIFIDGDPERQKRGAAEARVRAGAVCPSLLHAVQQLLLPGR